jgi:hypothetical protein
MNKHDLERIQRLTKRRDWLAARIAERKSNNLKANFDEAEHAALNWGIEIIELHLQNCKGGDR